jgi:hypothetical protein
MESILGVHDTPALSAAQELGVDAVEADQQDQDDLKGQLRDRYVRSFWEPVPEGAVSCGLFPDPNSKLMASQDPVMPGVLQYARQTAEKHAQAAEDAKSDPKILGTHEGNPPKVQLLPSGSTAGRPKIQFVDVGGKFIDVKEHAARAKESVRRRSVKDKKKVPTS